MFSVILPTVGRDTLAESLASCQSPLVDEILVAPDGEWAQERSRELAQPYDRVRILDTIEDERMDQVGGPQRNKAMLQACSPWLCYLDDDDRFTPGAFEAIAANLSGLVPHIYRMRYVNDSGGIGNGTVLWAVPELQPGNLGTPCFVVPNRKLGFWPSRRMGDWAFIQETCRLQGAPRFVDQVIVEVRPQAVVTT